MCNKKYYKEKNIKENNFDKVNDICNLNKNDLCCYDKVINNLNNKIIYLKKKNKNKKKIIKNLNNSLLDLKKNQNDLNLRYKANLENIYKLNKINIDKVYKYSLESFSKELLVILDSLKSSIYVKDKLCTDKINYEGLILTLKNFLSIFKKFGIIVLNNFKKFDPNYHQAISVVNTKDKKKDNVIFEVLQDGYLINNRLLRPAIVKVFKYKKV